MRAYFTSAILVLTSLATAWAAPPKAPPEVTGRPNDLVEITVAVDEGKELGYLAGFDSKEAPFTEVTATQPGTRKFWMFPKTAGVYTIAWWTVGEKTGAYTRVTTGTPSTPPPGTTPPPVDPPPGVTPKPLFFAIIRADGPADREFEQLLGDPAWDKLSKAGHGAKEYQQSEVFPRLNYRLPDGTRLPCVVTLRQEAAGSRVVRGPINLPTTSEGILSLPDGVK